MKRLVAILLALCVSLVVVLAPPDGYCAGSDAGKAVSGLTASPTPAAGDLLLIVDVSDTSMGSAGTSKKATVRELGRAGVTIFTDENWVEGGVTLTTVDLGGIIVFSATSDYQVFLPQITSGESIYMVELLRESIGGVSLYAGVTLEAIGNGGVSTWTPRVASGASVVAALKLRVGPSAVTWTPVSQWPLSGTGSWLFSE